VKNGDLYHYKFPIDFHFQTECLKNKNPEENRAFFAPQKKGTISDPQND
jgi:hypothetical protein